MKKFILLLILIVCLMTVGCSSEEGYNTLKNKEGMTFYNITDAEHYTYPFGTEIWEPTGDGKIRKIGKTVGIMYSEMYNDYYYLILGDDPVEPEKYWYVWTVHYKVVNKNYYGTKEPVEYKISTIFENPEIAGYSKDLVFSAYELTEDLRRIPKEEKTHW